MQRPAHIHIIIPISNSFRKRNPPAKKAGDVLSADMFTREKNSLPILYVRFANTVRKILNLYSRNVIKQHRTCRIQKYLVLLFKIVFKYKYDELRQLRSSFLLKYPALRTILTSRSTCVYSFGIRLVRSALFSPIPVRAYKKRRSK